MHTNGHRRLWRRARTVGRAHVGGIIAPQFLVTFPNALLLPAFLGLFFLPVSTSRPAVRAKLESDFGGFERGYGMPCRHALHRHRRCAFDTCNHWPPTLQPRLPLSCLHCTVPNDNARRSRDPSRGGLPRLYLRDSTLPVAPTTLPVVYLAVAMAAKLVWINKFSSRREKNGFFVSCLEQGARGVGQIPGRGQRAHVEGR
jgi:hypothetical protein